MNKKIITGCTLVLTICFILMGAVFKETAQNQRGVGISTGVMINGQYSENESGRIGENKEKYETFNNGGTIFYVLAGVTGVICVVSFIKRKN